MASNLHQTRSDHWEAVRLAWKNLHIPVGTLLIGGLLLAGVLSAVATVWGQGPVNPIP
jgi:hypothetical protein